MAWAHNITQKVMNSAQALLATSSLNGVPTTSILAGIDDETLPNPRIVCLCREANVTDVPFSGNWIARLEIVVRSNADDSSIEEHFDRAGEAFDLFFTDTTLEDLSSAIPEFTAFQIVPDRQTYEREDRSWVSTMTMELACCGSVITES